MTETTDTATDDILIDASEVARIIGVKTATVYTFRFRGIMPPPDDMFGQTPVWRKSVIEHWDATRPRRGRPALYTPEEKAARAERARIFRQTRNHPVQYARIAGVIVYGTEDLTDAEIEEFARRQAPAMPSGLTPERYDKCPTCDQWSPCDERLRVMAGGR